MEMLPFPSKLVAKVNTTHFLFITTTLSFLFFLWGVNSWKFAFVGDDWQFYLFAKNLAEAPLYPNPLSFNGVYHSHSILASLYQAFFLDIFGENNIAWRLSNIILIFPLSFFFYRWTRLLFHKDIAILATLFLQCSFYLANFFKIGYDNPQSLTLFIVCLYLATRFGKHPTKKLGFWLGLMLGVSFYIYIGPFFPLLIWPFLLPLWPQLTIKKVRHPLFVLIGTFFVLLLPILFHLSSLTHVLTSLGKTSSFTMKQTVLQDFLLFYTNHDYFYNHFVIGPYLDIVSGMLCLIGSIFALFHSKELSYRMLVFSYVSTVIVIGMTSPDTFSPITRGIFFLPYGFLFAGIGLYFLQGKIKNDTVSLIICWLIVLVVITLNAYQSQVGVFQNKNAGYSGMALIIRSLQQAQRTHQHTIIVLSPTMSINTYMWTLPHMLQAYGLQHVAYQIINPSQLDCTTLQDQILLFKKDIAAQQKAASLTCIPPKTARYTLLSPDIGYF